MPHATPRPPMPPEPLRSAAEIRLKTGTAPPAGHTLSPDALGLLYRLATSPDTAADGLKLLHELQVHQVEIDLQQNQLAANEQDLANRLAHYQTLFACAPTGYLVVSRDGNCMEGNLAAMQLLGVRPGQLHGQPLAAMLAPASQPALATLLQQLQANDTRRIAVTAAGGAAQARVLQLSAALAPDGSSVLINLCA